MLAELMAEYFAGAVRLRGKEYFRTKRVHIINWNDEFASFQVRGSQTYTVKLQPDFANNRIYTTCTCPHFSEGSACKHLWAALLRADGMNAFPAVADMYKLELILAPKASTVGGSASSTIVVTPNSPPAIDWRRRIRTATNSRPESQQSSAIERGGGKRLKNLFLAIDLDRSAVRDSLVAHLLNQEILKNDRASAMKVTPLSHEDIASFTDPQDQDILWALLGRGRQTAEDYGRQRGTSAVSIEGRVARSVLLTMARRKKLLLVPPQKHTFYGISPSNTKTYDYLDELWHLRLNVERENEAGDFQVTLEIKNQNEVRPLQQIVSQSGEFIFFADYLARASFKSDNPWLKILEGQGQLTIPAKDMNEFLELYFSAPHAPEIILPEDLRFAETTLDRPSVRVVIDQVELLSHLSMHLEFKYGEKTVNADDARPAFYDLKTRTKTWRDLDFELQVKNSFARFYTDETEFNEENLIAAIEAFIGEGWEVLVAQKAVQPNVQPKVTVKSGIDWFDVNVKFDVGGQSLSLPQLLRRNSHRRLLVLDDGSVGLLPKEWLQKFQALSEFGQVTEGEEVRLNKVQALFISEVFSDIKNLQSDKKFDSLKNLVSELNSLEPQIPERTFKGDLRPYQQVGLAWLTALAKHGIGGILADDMGLGKTVQVLAALAKAIKTEKVPTLIVAPKSLVFNWIKEAEKFCPHLKVLNYSGSDRKKLHERINDHDIVITTYQTLRNDIEILRTYDFSYFVLDEAHYVKNFATQNAMACQLVKAKKKFALTGTPVENSLSDLFSVMSIINPGLISKTMLNRWGQERNSENLKVLAQAFKPFLLRRKKEQVLKDLPEKSEQILYCELSAEEQKNYDELKLYYWEKLSGHIESKGLGKSKIEILEGLLRLRQAACHPGLLKQEFKAASSTKFDLLLEHIQTVIDDGHKALIFSQFTSLLDLLKTHIENKKITYEYLDGKTKDRQERVERFQNSNDVKLFLLSLKAGGVGLNLTAADYVFILDPWWNPAAEMQAIDRAHRIGQNRKVFAYKIIAKNTVEEKILELQSSKRQLAQAVVGDDTSMLKNLSLNELKDIFA